MLIVSKIGGSVLKNGLPDNFALDIKKASTNHKVIIVHGGGNEVTEISQKMGIEQRFVVSPKGFRSRYTDKDTMQVFIMVMAGGINKEIVTTLQSYGVASVGLSGIDGMLVQAERKERILILDERGRRRLIDGGYTGKITKIHGDLLGLLLEKGFTPVLAPVAIGQKFEPLNVDGDRMAANVAVGVKAQKLVFFTDVKGVSIGGKVVPRITVSQVKEVLPKIGYGMITKMYAALEAINGGVEECVITSISQKLPLTSSIENKSGTVVCRE